MYVARADPQITLCRPSNKSRFSAEPESELPEAPEVASDEEIEDIDIAWERATAKILKHIALPGRPRGTR